MTSKAKALLDATAKRDTMSAGLEFWQCDHWEPGDCTRSLQCVSRGPELSCNLCQNDQHDFLAFRAEFDGWEHSNLTGWLLDKYERLW